MGLGKGAATKRLTHLETVSSNGFITSTAGQVVTFPDPLNNIVLQAQGPGDSFKVKFNNESVQHLVTSKLPLGIDEFKIERITIIESGKNFMYTGLF